MKATRQQTSTTISTLVDNRRRFLTFVTRRIGDPSDAEEILQAAFVRSVEKSDTIRDGESAVAWFYRLLRNAIIDHYRHRDAERRALKQMAGMSAVTETTEPGLERVVCQCVNGLLPTLKDDYADLLRRVDLESESILKVAKENGMTSNNTRVKLHRARMALRKQLELSCGSCAKHGCLDCECQRPRQTAKPPV